MPRVTKDTPDPAWLSSQKKGEGEMIIGSAAYFKVCKCGGHGRIIAADGTWGPECASKEAALCSVEAGCRSNMITELEVPELMHMIENSELPAKDDGANFMGKMWTELINELRLDNREEFMRAMQDHEEGEGTTRGIPRQWKM